MERLGTPHTKRKGPIRRKEKIMSLQLSRYAIILVAILTFFPSWSFAWEYPVIKGYGRMEPLPNAAFQPDKAIKYRVLFDITKASEGVDKINPGLDRVARFLNVMAASGILPKDMDLAAVIHGQATPSVLKNEIFKGRFKADNPNREIIKGLKEAGVKLYVCGQTLAEDGFKEEWVNEQIAIAVSALVVVPTYQLKGYACVPLF